MKMNTKLSIGTLVLTGILWMSCGENKKTTDESVAQEIGEALSVEAYEVDENNEQSVLNIVMGEIEFATLSQGIKSADLVESLKNTDSITLFAPTNDAFSKLPEGKVSDLMQPLGKDALITLLQYHLVHGMYDVSKLRSMVAKNNGTLELNTLQGNKIKFTKENGNLILTDHLGETAQISRPNLTVSRNVVHGIDMVLTPQ